MSVVITGAGSPNGIGRTTALTFAGAGADLVLMDLDEHGLRSTATEAAALGVRVHTEAVDLTDTAAVDAACRSGIAALGPVSTIVANAGVARKRAFAETTDEEWAFVMETNLGGSRRVIRALLPQLIEQGSGSIVITSSHMGSARGWADHVPYSASKAAIEGMTRALAMEVAPLGIRVNAVAPGFVLTNQLLDPVNSAGEAGLVALRASVPLGRIGDPQDIADVIAFLASDRAAYITGQTILVDGGVNLRDG